MPVHVGAHAERLAKTRRLLTAKGRQEQRRFTFEGPTLLYEAHRSGIVIEQLYVTQAAYDANPLTRELDAAGTPTFLLDERAAVKISDVVSPTGIVAVAAASLHGVSALLEGPGVVLVLAGLSDPANAGALLRSAEAFGASGVVFGSPGVDPYHPKVVRAAMGALFRLRVARASPIEFRAAASAAALPVIGLAPGATPIRATVWPPACALVVGHERAGLESWREACDRFLGIPICAQAESLNAAIAGSIALFEACQ